MKKIYLLIISMLLFFGCKQEMEKSAENLDWFFEQNKFEIIGLHYYGLELNGECKIKFEKMKDSIIIETTYFAKEPQERMISYNDFNEVKKIFKCLTQIDSNEVDFIRDDVYPSKVEYVLKKNNKEMKLPNTNFKCDVTKVFSENLDFPNLLDLITGF